MARHLARTASLSIGSRRAASPKHLHLLRRQLSILVGIHRLEDLARRIARKKRGGGIRAAVCIGRGSAGFM